MGRNVPPWVFGVIKWIYRGYKFVKLRTMENIKIHPEFMIGETVFVRTDKDQNPCIVNGYQVRIGGHLIYLVSRDTDESAFYDFELSRDRDVMMTSTN